MKFNHLYFNIFSYRKLGFLVPVLFWAVSIILVFCYMGLIYKVGYELIKLLGIGAVPDNGVAIRNTGFLLVTMLGAPFVAWRAISAAKQADAAQQGQITDRFTNAVEQLAAVRRVPEVREIDGHRVSIDTLFPSIDIRIGGLYALERISRDSRLDHFAVMETICAYVRTHANQNTPEISSASLLYPFLASSNNDYEENYCSARPDIYAALLILGRRDQNRIKFESDQHFHLDLSGTKLRLIDMEKGNFSYTNFLETDFTAACLRDTNLTAAWLRDAIFDNAAMRNCILYGAALPRADLRNAQELTLEMVKDAYGVCYGKYMTKLPNNFPDPEEFEWFRPSSPNLPLSEFLQEFDVEYDKHLQKLNL